MNLLSLLTELGVEYKTEGQHEHARGGWAQIDCPFCSPRAGRYRLGINLEKGYSNCWACGPRTLVNVLGELTSKPAAVCLQLLKGVGWEKFKREERTPGILKIPGHVGPLGPAHRAYLRQRGFDPAEIERLWSIQAIGLAVRLSWRLFIPFHVGGEMVSWTTRAIGKDVEKRYIMASAEEEKLPAKSLLYGIDYVRHAVVVCEGPLDVWAIGPGAVCTMGLKFTEEQMLKISRYPLRAICFDAEPAAQRRATRLAKQLLPLPGETHVVELESGKDAAEANREEIEELRQRFLGGK